MSKSHEQCVPLSFITKVFNKERAALYQELYAARRDYKKALAKQRKTREALIAAKAKLQAIEELEQTES